jgi:hypothetical protein
MAELNKTDYEAKFAANTGGAAVFKDNTTEDIGANDMRALGLDTKDSAMFLQDNFIDEDSFATDSATKSPSQQSVKSYVAAQLLSGGINDTDLKYFEQFDFIYSTFSGDLVPIGWAPSMSGAGSQATPSNFGVNATENAIGVVDVETGTTTTGRTSIHKGLAAGVTFGIGNEMKLRMRIALQALSDGTETYTAYFGFGHTITSGDMSVGLYFRYTHSVNSGKIEAVIADASSRTSADTGITPVAGVYNIFDIRINAAGTSATFYIDAVLVATLTGANLPDAGDTTGMIMKIEKSAGTTSRSIYMDWYDLLISRTTAR